MKPYGSAGSYTARIFRLVIDSLGSSEQWAIGSVSEVAVKFFGEKPTQHSKKIRLKIENLQISKSIFYKLSQETSTQDIKKKKNRNLQISE